MRPNRLALCALLAVAAAGCTTSTGARSGSPTAQAETAVAQVLVSDEQENQIGDQVFQQLQQKGTRFVSDPAVTGYVSSIASPLFALAQRDRPGVNWRVLVIDDPKTVNAFSTPGGRLYVYSGLLAAVDNDAQLAGVLGHEIGHEVGRHIARQLVLANGMQAIADLALGRNPGQAAQVAAQLAGTGGLLAFSRSDETEADEYGARYAAASGHDPNQLISFFQKLQAKEGQVPGVMAFLSDHPLTADRISHLREFIAANRLSGSVASSAALGQAKARLGAPGQAPAPSTQPSGAPPVHGAPPAQPSGSPPVHSAPPSQPGGTPPVHGAPKHGATPGQ